MRWIYFPRRFMFFYRPLFPAFGSLPLNSPSWAPRGKYSPSRPFLYLPSWFAHHPNTTIQGKKRCSLYPIAARFPPSPLALPATNVQWLFCPMRATLFTIPLEPKASDVVPLVRGRIRFHFLAMHKSVWV